MITRAEINSAPLLQVESIKVKTPQLKLNIPSGGGNCDSSKIEITTHDGQKVEGYTSIKHCALSDYYKTEPDTPVLVDGNSKVIGRIDCSPFDIGEQTYSVNRGNVFTVVNPPSETELISNMPPNLTAHEKQRELAARKVVYSGNHMAAMQNNLEKGNSGGLVLSVNGNGNDGKCGIAGSIIRSTNTLITQH